MPRRSKGSWKWWQSAKGCSILAGRMGIVYKTHEENKHWTVTFRKTTLGPQPAQIAVQLIIYQPKAKTPGTIFTPIQVLLEAGKS